jgi:uncharacterized membrane protein
MTGLNIMALVLSVILSWHYLMGGSMIGCGGGSPCEQVLNSRWSVLAGILPVSGLAAGVYLAFLVAGFFTGPDTEFQLRQLAWKVMLILAGAVAGSAVWFTILQKWVIGDFCPYCMTAHITGMLLSALVIWRAVCELEDDQVKKTKAAVQKLKQQQAVVPQHMISKKSSAALVLAGLGLTGIMATFQVAFTGPVAYQDGNSRENLPVFDYHSVPVVGSPDAPYIVTVLFDYNCSHCQTLHFMLNEAVERYNGKLAFALCPTPLNTACNPYIPQDAEAFKNSCELARTGLAVWLARREAFHEYGNWMFTFDSGDYWLPRSFEASKVKAAELVGKAAFDKALADPWIDEYIKDCVQVFGRTMQSGRGGIPKMIFGSKWVIPQPGNTDDLITILQESLGVPVP